MRGSAPTPAAGIECPEGRPPAEKRAALGSQGQGNKLRVGPRCPRRAVPHQVALSVHPRAWGPGRTRSNGLARHTAVVRRAQAGCKARWPGCPCASAGGRGRAGRAALPSVLGAPRGVAEVPLDRHRSPQGGSRALSASRSQDSGADASPADVQQLSPRGSRARWGGHDRARSPGAAQLRRAWRMAVSALSPGRPQGPGSFRSAVAARAWRPRRSRVDRVADTGRVEERPARPRATCCLRPPEPVRAPRRPRWAPGDAAPCAPCPWGLTQ